VQSGDLLNRGGLIIKNKLNILFKKQYFYIRANICLGVNWKFYTLLLEEKVNVEYALKRIVEKDVVAGDGITSIVKIDYAMVLKARMHAVESVTATVSIDAGRRGKVEVELVSPNGTRVCLVLSESMIRILHFQVLLLTNFTFIYF
jgi:hypothetical protein